MRDKIVAAVRDWIGTPYHHRAAVKGAGVDCGRILIEVYAEVGLIEGFDPGFYTHDWHLHKQQEVYLGLVEDRTLVLDSSELSLNERLMEDPRWEALPGDILMWKIGKTYSHAGIVTVFPNVVHASWPSRIVEEVSIKGTIMAEKPMRVFSPGNIE